MVVSGDLEVLILKIFALGANHGGASWDLTPWFQIHSHVPVLWHDVFAELFLPFCLISFWISKSRSPSGPHPPRNSLDVRPWISTNHRRKLERDNFAWKEFGAFGTCRPLEMTYDSFLHVLFKTTAIRRFCDPEMRSTVTGKYKFTISWIFLT
jgi:hypothetical protein